MAEFDSEAILREAYKRLPLDRFLTAHGTGPKNPGETWKSFECPFCHKKKKAGIFERDGVKILKCSSFLCEGNKAMTQVGFLELSAGLSRSEAFKAYMKEAGIWKEPEKKALVNTTPPPPPAAQPGPEQPEETIDEETMHKVIELVRAENTASNSFLKEKLCVGFDKAAAVLKELEKRGVIGPARANAPREIFQEKVVPADFVAASAPTAVAKLLKFRPVSMWQKRGLATSTCHALGFVAGASGNRQILLDLEKDFSAEEREASGLWLPEDRKKRQPHRPNKQFCGLGQLGKKPDGERRGKDDKWQWRQCEPVLIPYFDEGGNIIKLRPHKGGAPSGTVCGISRVYIPRDPAKCPDIVENFSTVVITEGEFKAAALWQALGGGRDDGNPPIGVCAIPGINFGKDFILREELDAWLQSVQCRTVIVSFDNQDKSDKPMRERHEAIIWAQYLAADLQRKLHITGKVCVLPKEWRDENGKADWDGALARRRAV